MKPSTSAQTRQTFSDRVRQFLVQRGVVDTRSQIMTLMGIMEASHSQVYRKLSGRGSWVEDDLHRIAAHFGVMLEALFVDGGASAAAVASSSSGMSWQPAMLTIGSVGWPCEVTLDVQAPAAGDLVLCEQDQQAWVLPMAQPLAGRVMGRVVSLRLDTHVQAQGGFAVLDDDAGVVDAIVDHLALKGLPAQGFYAVADLQACSRRFDTYILDWYGSDGSTVMNLVQHLKAVHAPEATIVILTGQIQRGQAEADLAALIQSHAVLVELKPIRLELLLAKVEVNKQAAGQLKRVARAV